MTLNQPSPKDIFNKNQAELECVITGQDKTIVNEIQITWQIDGQNVNDNITVTTKSVDGQHSKTSTVTRGLTVWLRVNKVRCSASRDNMTPVIQDLTVHKGGMLLSVGDRLEQQSVSLERQQTYRHKHVIIYVEQT